MRWNEDQLAEYNARRGTPGARNAADVSTPPFVPPVEAGVDPVTVTLAGDPQGKGRARSFVRNGSIGHYTPESTRDYEASIKAAATAVMAGRAPIDQPVEFIMRAIFAVPASWSQKKRDAAIRNEIRPGKKPDLDNVAKAWWDALNGTVYRDDCLIVRCTFEKRYGPQALVVATVRTV